MRWGWKGLESEENYGKGEKPTMKLEKPTTRLVDLYLKSELSQGMDRHRPCTNPSKCKHYYPRISSSSGKPMGKPGLLVTRRKLVPAYHSSVEENGWSLARRKLVPAYHSGIGKNGWVYLGVSTFPAYHSSLEETAGVWPGMNGKLVPAYHSSLEENGWSLARCKCFFLLIIQAWRKLAKRKWFPAYHPSEKGKGWILEMLSGWAMVTDMKCLMCLLANFYQGMFWDAE